MPCPLPCAQPALWQIREGSRFLSALNSVDETPGDVSYTSIWSRTDELVQTFALGEDTSVLDGASNVAIQDLCPGRPVSHFTLEADAVGFALVMDALTHTGPTNPARFDEATCLQSTMPGVSLTEGRGDPIAGYATFATAERAREEPPLAPYTM